MYLMLSSASGVRVSNVFLWPAMRKASPAETDTFTDFVTSLLLLKFTRSSDGVPKERWEGYSASAKCVREAMRRGLWAYINNAYSCSE